MNRIVETMIIRGGEVDRMDTIFHEGQFWLVPNWFLSPDGKQMTPMRIIALTTIPHEKYGDGFVIKYPLPPSVFLGHPPKGTENLYIIRENPKEIVFPNPDVLN